MTRPLVTVLMPVYNGEKYIKEAVDSILSQTFDDFELLIIDDGSKDESVAKIESYNDPRIRLVKSKHQGLIATLNKGLDLAKGEYVARMDQDDISVPSRLETQFRWMNKHTDISVCGSWIKIFSGSTRFGAIIRKPINPEEIHSELLIRNSIQHPTAFIRKSDIKKYKFRYNKSDVNAEDYGFWISIDKKLKLANIPEVLLFYRYHANSIGTMYSESQKETVQKIRERNWGTLIPDLKNSYKTNLQKVCDLQKIQKLDELVLLEKVVDDFLQKILKLKLGKKYNPAVTEKVFSKTWFGFCSKNATLGLPVWEKYKYSRLAKNYKLSLREKISFFSRCALKINDINITRNIARLVAGFK